MAPDWTASSIEQDIGADDLRYFSTYDLSLNAEYEFGLRPTSLDDFVASLAPAGHRTTSSRVATTMDELVRRYTPPKTYTARELKQYQKHLFGVLNKRVSSFLLNLVSGHQRNSTNRKQLVDLGTKYRIL